MARLRGSHRYEEVAGEFGIHPADRYSPVPRSRPRPWVTLSPWCDSPAVYTSPKPTISSASHIITVAGSMVADANDSTPAREEAGTALATARMSRHSALW